MSDLSHKDFIPKGVLKLSRDKDIFLKEYNEFQPFSEYEMNYEDFFFSIRDGEYMGSVGTSYFPSFLLFMLQNKNNSNNITPDKI